MRVNIDFGEEVLDTDKALKAVVRSKMKPIIQWVIISVAWSVACVFLLPARILISDFSLFIVGLPWLLLIGWFGIVRSMIREAFWIQLAKKYKWIYTSYKNTLSEKALLFQMGEDMMAGHGINGEYGGRKIHIFEYKYETGSGKSRQIYEFTVFEICFDGTFPHVYLNHKMNGYSNPPTGNNLATLSLPKEFTDKFQLYAPKEYEIEVLEIFTPEVLLHFVESGLSHDIELVDGELIIYSKKKFSTYASLDIEVKSILKTVDMLAPRLDRLKLELIGDRPHLLST